MSTLLYCQINAKHYCINAIHWYFRTPIIKFNDCLAHCYFTLLSSSHSLYAKIKFHFYIENLIYCYNNYSKTFKSEPDSSIMTFSNPINLFLSLHCLLVLLQNNILQMSYLNCLWVFITRIHDTNVLGISILL